MQHCTTRPRASHWLLLLLLVLAPSTVLAQSFDVQGGYSTLFNGQGGKITFRDANYEGWLGAGSLSGNLRLGGYLQTRLHGLTVGAGDTAAQFNLPTDVFTGGQYLLIRGVDFKQTITEKTAIHAFGGTSSLGFSAPFMQTAEADTPMGMIFIDHKITPTLRLFSRNIFSGRQTSINGLQYRPIPWFDTALAAGMGSNQGYLSSSLHIEREKLDVKAGFAVSGERFHRIALPSPASSEIDGANFRVSARPSAHLRLTGAHQNYLRPSDLNQPAQKATTNELGADLSALDFRFGANVYRTEANGVRGAGTSFTVGRKLTRWFDASGNYLRSEAQGYKTESLLTGSLREKLHPRINLLQFVTRTNGQTMISWGGEFISNPIRLNVDYQTVYVPFNVGKPFTQALMVSATTRLFGAFQMHLGTFVDPIGRVRYTISASDFLYRSHGGGLREGLRQKSLRLPKYLVRGRVIDEQSKPVNGAAIYVGEHLAYSGSDGRFFVRISRRRVEELRVATDEFTVPGFWQLLNAPASVTPQTEVQASEIEVVVKRLAPAEAWKLRNPPEPGDDDPSGTGVGSHASGGEANSRCESCSASETWAPAAAARSRGQVVIHSF
jgi:hypothetical protein